MTEEQKALVQSTWEKVVPIADTAAKLFYEKLFELDPNLRPLFKPDMTEQRKVLMNTITFAVRGLDKLDEVVPAVQALGRRHVDYGVKDRDYDTVGAALLWTLGQGLGDAFTPEVKEAWTTVYGLLATTMKEAAAKA
jgi:hemoglobin-like flavoprotein